MNDSFWDYLFNSSPYQQHFAIKDMKKQIALDAELDSQRTTEQYKRFAQLYQKVEHLELLNTALIELLKSKNLLSQEELALMIQRIDLADGFEDGRIGPDRSQQAPKCEQCHRPVNPKREQCIYCYAPLSENNKNAKNPPIRKVECNNCRKEIPETESYFSELGLVCLKCFH